MRWIGSLFLVLAFARLVVIVLRTGDGVRPSGWLVLASMRDSAIAALALAVAVGIFGEPPTILALGVYVPWCVAAVVNVPVSRVFGTSTTAMMLGASGGAISDSFGPYVKASNVLGVGAVIVAAFATTFMPWFLEAPPLFVGLAVLAIASHVAVRRTRTRGIHRDPVVTLVRTRLARRAPRRMPRIALPGEGEHLDLGHLAGVARGRNVIWISLESTAARYVSAYGAPHDVLPAVSSLGALGLTFERAYAVCPESIRGLASWLCSFTPTPQTPPATYAASAFPADSIAQVAKDAGFRTALFHSGRFDYLSMREVIEERGFDLIRDAEAIPAMHVESFGIDESSVVQAILKHLDEHRDEPSFVVYLPIAGHHPYAAPGSAHAAELDDRDRYLLDLAHGDRAIAALLEGVRERGLWDTTLFVVHGDHGEAFGEHDGNVIHTFQAYEENVRVPLFIVAPGSDMGPLRVPNLTTLVDLAPTVAELLGLPLSSTWEGRSALRTRSNAFAMFADYGVEQFAVRDGRWKLVLTPEAGTPELFDVDEDPLELHDRAASEPGRVHEYTKALARFRRGP